MPQPKGQMQALVLEDGTVKIETGDMGGVAHKDADAFLAMMAKLMGGEQDVQKLKTTRHQHHDHGHDHDHEHA